MDEDIPFTQVPQRNLSSPPKLAKVPPKSNYPPSPIFLTPPESRLKEQPSGPSKPANLEVSPSMNELCHKLMNKYNELVPLISRGLELSDSRHPVDHDFFLNHLKAIKEHINSYVVAGGRRRKTRRHHKKRKL